MSRDITTIPPVAANERVRYGDEASQFFDLFLPQNESRGSAVMIHGGFWRAMYDLLHASHVCAALAHEGIATANLEYRRVGESGGGWPGTYEDVVAGFDAAQKRLGPNIVVLGHSAGGHLALRLAADRRASGVVALAAVADLKLGYELNLSDGAVSEFLGGAPEAIPERYLNADPCSHPSSVRRCLIHGEEDDTVPIALSRSYMKARAADQPEIVLKTVHGGHLDLIDPESGSAWDLVLKTVKAFVEMK